MGPCIGRTMATKRKNRDGRKKLLYRKVNTRALRVEHYRGGDYRHERRIGGQVNREQDYRNDVDRVTRVHSMRRGERRGLDYTPLFRFLLSKVGKDWDEVYREARSRLDREAPIFWMVARRADECQDYFGADESTYFSKLYVDGDNRLRKVNPRIGPGTLTPTCKCCHHTFNGMPFTRKYRPE